jgi:chromosome partitioning protein
MANTIAIVSSKGGTGKTTIALNLSAALAEKGHRTLLVDLDPQGAIGLSLARSDTEWRGLLECLLKKTPLAEALVQTQLETLTILPRGRLDPSDTCEFEYAMFATGFLKNTLDELSGDFQYVLLDTPSGLGMITRAALISSGYAMITLQAEPLSLRSLSQVLRLLDTVRQKENPELMLLGIVPTMIELGNESSLNALSALWSGFCCVFDTVMPRASIFTRASEVGLPLAFLAGKKQPEARRFEMLALETVAMISDLSGKAGEDARPQRNLL